MNKSTFGLRPLLIELSAAARRRGLNDSAWAKAAGVRKETLSRLRSRSSCDFVTLESLAERVGARIGVHVEPLLPADSSGHLPEMYGREEEAILLRLAVSGDLTALCWRETGPAFFMAGLAVMLAGARGFNRPQLLKLAEDLYPGSSHTAVFSLWLDRSPLQASRFFSQLEQVQNTP
jgi:hypothetical protein